MPSTTIVNTDKPLPSWDGAPLEQGPWYFSLEEYLESCDKRFATLWTKGYILDKHGNVCVRSVHHAVILRDQLDLRAFSFTSPAPHDPVESLRQVSPAAHGRIASAAQLSDADKQYYLIRAELIAR